MESNTPAYWVRGVHIPRSLPNIDTGNSGHHRIAPAPTLLSERGCENTLRDPGCANVPSWNIMSAHAPWTGRHVPLRGTFRNV